MAIRFLQGNEAVALAALQAGMQFYAGYPITPASEIMEILAEEPARTLRALCCAADVVGRASAVGWDDSAESEFPTANGACLR